MLNGTYNISVGNGVSSANGQNSSFSNNTITYTAIGGGKGGNGGNIDGNDGGCGGGAGGFGANNNKGGKGTYGQGGDGKKSQSFKYSGTNTINTGGGGGGAGSINEISISGDTINNTHGGIGFKCNISGNNIYYGGGGAGSGSTYASIKNGHNISGGLGGGGHAPIENVKGIDGTNGLGGGGSASFKSGSGGIGGSGIVIIRWYNNTSKNIINGNLTINGITNINGLLNINGYNIASRRAYGVSYTCEKTGDNALLNEFYIIYNLLKLSNLPSLFSNDFSYPLINSFINRVIMFAGTLNLFSIDGVNFGHNGTSVFSKYIIIYVSTNDIDLNTGKLNKDINKATFSVDYRDDISFGVNTNQYFFISNIGNELYLSFKFNNQENYYSTYDPDRGKYNIYWVFNSI